MEKNTKFNWINVLKNLDAIIAAGLLVFVIFCVCLNIIMRFFFKISLGWSDEMVAFSYVWCIMFGAAVVMREKGHICIEMLVELMPDKIQQFVQLAVDVICFGIFVWMTRLAYVYAFTQSSKVTGILRIPYKYEYMAFVVGFFLMSCYMIPHILHDIKRITANERTSDE